MAASTVRISKKSSPSDWVFVWREVEPPVIPRLIALGFGIALFTFLIGVVRIQVVAPEKTSMRQASLIYLKDDADGRAWTLRAREGGPFPSRFEPNHWQGLAELENAALDAARYRPSPYVPAMQDLTNPNQLESSDLAAKGKLYLPKRQTAAVAAPDLIQLKLAPIIYPLSGISFKEVPTDLPPFNAPIEAEMSAVSWRFLLKLDAAGTVSECVSLAKGGAAGADALRNWLSQIRFPSEPGNSSRWISVAVAFTNQPTDGTEIR